jgi:hypothetical protein
VRDGLASPDGLFRRHLLLDGGALGADVKGQLHDVEEDLEWLEMGIHEWVLVKEVELYLSKHAAFLDLMGDNDGYLAD